jgi:CRP-like cAMP-binding protein
MGKISEANADALAKRIVSRHSFPGASHAAVVRILAKGDCRSLPHGTLLCVEGEPGDHVFFLVSGNISVTRKDTQGKEQVLSDMTCPCVFGHMAVIDGSKRSASCKANGPVEIVTLRRSQVDQLVTEASVAGAALRRLLIASLCDQLSSANGFVRKIVLDHAVDPTVNPANSTPQNTPSPLGKKQRAEGRGVRAGQQEDLRALSAKLGGWAPGEFESLEGKVELVTDEDQKRTFNARRRS